MEENVGQAPAQARFLAKGSGYVAYATEEALVFAVAGGSAETGSGTDRQVVRLAFAAAAQVPTLEVTGSAPGVSHYFVGDDSARWLRDVPHVAGFAYRDLWPGVDLLLAKGLDGGLAAAFTGLPVDLRDRVRISVEGAQAVSVDPQGNLVLQLSAGDLLLPAPVFRAADGPVSPAMYVIGPQGLVGLVPGDPVSPSVSGASPLPSLSFGARFMGTRDDGASGVAVDALQNLYLAGNTLSLDLPPGLLGAPGWAPPNNDGYVAMLDPTASHVLWATYFGGSRSDPIYGLALGPANLGSGGPPTVHIAGLTTSRDLPTRNAHQPAFAGDPTDAFVVKLAPLGRDIVYSTYLGGKVIGWWTGGTDGAFAIDVDPTGTAHVAGMAGTSDFPLVNPIHRYKSAEEAFVSRFDATGRLVFSTFLGGSVGIGHPIGDDRAQGVAAGVDGSSYVTGYTRARDFPVTPGAPQPALGGGDRDAFLAKIDAAGALAYATYLGGAGEDMGRDVAVDALGQAVAVGTTHSANFPTTPQAFQRAPGGAGTPNDGFVARAAADGRSFMFVSYLGGSGGDQANSVAVDARGAATVVGLTSSRDLPGADPSRPLRGGLDALLVRVSPGGDTLEASTYVGGNAGEWANAVALDALGAAVLAGPTSSPDFPAPVAAPLPAGHGNRGGYEAFVVRVLLPSLPAIG